jgi:hypothetical protein
MRTLEEIKIIKSRIADPYSISNFISKQHISHLVKLFNLQPVEHNKVYKNTGPITLDIVNFLDDPVVKYIFDQLKDHIGPFELNAGFFFWTNYPHIIHNDDTYDLNDVYKGITIPLALEGNYTESPKLCFFDQCYYQGPSKFFNGDRDIPTYYNQQIYSYEDVENTVSGTFPEADRIRYFTHLRPQWLDGLSLWGTLDWVPGHALIFDSVRLHCASDFRQQGIKSKLGISIFTKLKTCTSTK